MHGFHAMRLPRKNRGERINSSADRKEAIINNKCIIELAFSVRIGVCGCHSFYSSTFKDLACGLVHNINLQKKRTRAIFLQHGTHAKIPTIQGNFRSLHFARTCGEGEEIWLDFCPFPFYVLKKKRKS